MTTAVRSETGTSTPLSTGSAVVRGAVGGVVAGAVFAAVTMWFTSSQGMGATMPLQMIAAMVQGQAALEGGTASPLVGVVVHMVLSAGFGAAFGLVAARLTDPLVAVAGLVFGALLYVVNFLVVAPLLFPWMQNANQPFELAVHVVFGALVAPFVMTGWSRPNRL
jgi:hypothetical protein